MSVSQEELQIRKGVIMMNLDGLNLEQFITVIGDVVFGMVYCMADGGHDGRELMKMVLEDMAEQVSNIVLEEPDPEMRGN